jgi:hypothetical protein
MSRRGPTRSRKHAGVDPALVLVLGCLVGLLVLFRAGLEVGATLVALGAAGVAGGVAGAVTRAHDPRHGLMLLTVIIAPTIAIERWSAGPYGVLWFVAAGTAAVAGRTYRKDRRRSGRSTTPGSTGRQGGDEWQRERAREQLPWMLAILAGLLIPLGAALLSLGWEAAVSLRLAVVLATLAATDAPLVAAGVRGRGADGIVQPWRWPAYLGWLVLRLLLVAVIVAPSPG